MKSLYYKLVGWIKLKLTNLLKNKMLFKIIFIILSAKIKSYGMTLSFIKIGIKILFYKIILLGLDKRD